VYIYYYRVVVPAGAGFAGGPGWSAARKRRGTARVVFRKPHRASRPSQNFRQSSRTGTASRARAAAHRTVCRRPSVAFCPLARPPPPTCAVQPVGRTRLSRVRASSRVLARVHGGSDRRLVSRLWSHDHLQFNCTHRHRIYCVGGGMC
jgi:hypothetical protein